METREEIVKEYEKLNKEIELIEKKQSDLRLAFKNLCPYSIGEKVKVTTWNDKVKECYVFHIGVKEHSNTTLNYEYTFTKEKKDGTMGQQSAGIYSVEKIEKITP